MKKRLSLLVLAVLTVCCVSGTATAQSLGTSYIIVHALNPEGVEIGSIEGVGRAEIYDGNSLIGYSAYDEATHNQPISISSGVHTIKVEFNSMALEQNVTLEPGETKQLAFIFDRTTANSPINIENSFSENQSGSLFLDAHEDIHPENTNDFTAYSDAIAGMWQIGVELRNCGLGRQIF